ncbi:MAG: UDP-3-O-(3-hydroxymyristoyl)glucosamine N-acyltransferase [Verrucomicrobiota bacterium]
MQRQLSELAVLIEGEIRGTPDILISGINDLGLAEAQELSFLGNSKYLRTALATKAGALIVKSEDAQNHSFPCPIIIVKNPSAAFAEIAKLFTPAPIAYKSGIHPTAIIAEDATVHPEAAIGPYAVVENGATISAHVHIGSGSYIGHYTTIDESSFIYPNVTIREYTKIAKNVIIHSGAVIGSDGFGYEFANGSYTKIPQTGYVQIDDHVEVGANTTIDRGRFARTWIKEGSKIDNLVMVAHNVVIGPHAIIVAQSGISGSTSCGAYFTMGGQSATVGHLKIGDQVTLTGRTAVTKDLPHKGVYRGAPAQPYAEQMKIEALTKKLPELYSRIKELEKQINNK